MPFREIGRVEQRVGLFCDYDTGVWTVSEGSDASLPTATGTVHDFISWGTKRADWRNPVVLSGEGADANVTALAKDTLDAINVI